MKERPILFSGPMVRAILDGRKTQTRRVIKPQPAAGVRESVFATTGLEDRHGHELRCPHGFPGDRLWVRETWCPLERCDWIGNQREFNVNYRADATPVGEAMREEMGYRWHPSISMPRWASRITLEIVSVRVQGVQEIGVTDARAEGIVLELPGITHITRDGVLYQQEKRLFRELWDSINAKRGYSWESNPWVWAITFQRV